MFSDTCRDVSFTPTVSENTFSGGTTTFNLLLETTKTITLPTLTVTPAGCNYVTTWQVKLKSDNTDQVLTLSSVFSISGSNLALSHTVSNYAQRITLFGNKAYYFIGTIDDFASTQSS